MLVVNLEALSNAFSDRFLLMDGWKSHTSKMINAWFFFFCYGFKPFYGVASTFPQVHNGHLDNFFMVYAVQSVVTDNANFSLQVGL